MVCLLTHFNAKASLFFRFQRLDLDESDHFSELVAVVTRLAPHIKIPWLTRPKEDLGKHLNVAHKRQSAPAKYFPLKVKKTVVKTRKKRKK